MTRSTSLSGTAVTTYTYDAANRLTSVAGVAYTWDMRGNLRSNGVTTYTYDGAGRMVQAQNVTLTLVYTYNADGLRVAQDVSGTTTAFVWDWATPVPEMLHDGDNVYLVGLDTLGWWDGEAWTFALPDALGSVRQTTDITGTVTANREWSPFGVAMDGAQAGLGYTGEWWDDGAGLLYLRARWYDSEMGRLTSHDPAMPDFYAPQSINRYVYVQNNAINLTDPSGLTPNSQYPDNPYDLTSWLYSELALNSNGYYVQRIRALRLGAANPLNPAGKDTLDKLRAFAAFYFLVKDKAKWDFKHEIKDVLQGEKIALDAGEELHWYEYSVPGNIHYGFVGRATGFTAFELHGGAGYAEITDPSHEERGEACCPQICYSSWTGDWENPVTFEHCLQLGCYYINPDWVKSLFDDPQDWASVEFGVQMYNTCGQQLTRAQFQDHLALHGDELTPAPGVYGPGMPNTAWPYHVGFFNGPDDATNERWLRVLLSKWW
jgi:RHS repeat-associated protein